MKYLGKIIFLLVLFFTATLYGSVKASVEPNVVYTGEVATYKLTISGEDIVAPRINSICGNHIVATSTHTSITMVNGDFTKNYVYSYDFVPKEDCIVEPVRVEVDGKIEESNSVKVVVRPPSQEKGVKFLLSLESSKERVYVGEPFVLTLTLKQKKDAQVVDSQFVEPDFKGFWLKEKLPATRKEDGAYFITTAKYKLAAQREGNLSIAPAQIRIATRVNTRDMWGSFMPQVKWRSYFSNSVSIEAQPLPNNAKLVGDFTITAVADKTTINPNEAVNVTVTVRGEGNLEDIESFKPYINGVNIFDEKIKIKGNTLTQKLAFVSDRDFTIPSFHLDFYNLKTQQVQRITTKPIQIKVQGAANTAATPNTQLHIQKVTNTQESATNTQQEGVSSSNVNLVWIVVAFVMGMGVGALLMFKQPWQLGKKEKKLNIKDEKVLLMKLMEFKDKDPEVQKIVDILENNIYNGASQKVDKKQLKEILKKYNIS